MPTISFPSGLDSATLFVILTAGDLRHRILIFGDVVQVLQDTTQKTVMEFAANVTSLTKETNRDCTERKRWLNSAKTDM